MHIFLEHNTTFGAIICWSYSFHFGVKMTFKCSFLWVCDDDDLTCSPCSTRHTWRTGTDLKWHYRDISLICSFWSLSFATVWFHWCQRHYHPSFLWDKKGWQPLLPISEQVTLHNTSVLKSLSYALTAAGFGNSSSRMKLTGRFVCSGSVVGSLFTFQSFLKMISLSLFLSVTCKTFYKLTEQNRPLPRLHFNNTVSNLSAVWFLKTKNCFNNHFQSWG